MSRLFRVSEATALGLHAAALLAGTPRRLVRTREIAIVFEASESHLAKVLLALERARLVRATRGPAGGFKLARPASRITLKEVVEAIEGPVKVEKCLFGTPVCGNRECILGDFVQSINKRIASKLAKTRLSEIRLELGVDNGHKKSSQNRR